MGHKMLGYGFEIIHKKGKLNVVADALSRKDEEVEALLCAISIIQLDWITKEGRRSVDSHSKFAARS